MVKAKINSDILQSTTFLPSKFNKKKFSIAYTVPATPFDLELQNLSKKQCFNKTTWPKIEKINGWMLTAETATFMKAGGLGMIASELPEAFNRRYSKSNEMLTVVTPLYLGDTKKKKASLNNGTYLGSEGNSVKIEKFKDFSVSFMDENEVMKKYKVEAYTGTFNNTPYLFLSNDRFFSINAHTKNPSAQDGCYVLNQHGIDEVERFAFFSKSVYELIKLLQKENQAPNIILANDWHSGALSGLMKYLPIALVKNKKMSEEDADFLRFLPIIHIAHHLGYQGWEYENAARILNSLYEENTAFVIKNAKAVKNSNSRTANTLIVHDCYNQASCNFHLADRLVTVSKNYLEEVSKELDFGFDFRDILKIRKDHRSFFGIVNGYDKRLISPNSEKIKNINEFFKTTDFKVFDENSLENKNHNKKEFIKLISELAKNKKYKDEILPLVNTYKFDDIANDIKDVSKVPVICATSRLVEQKGYDVAAAAITKYIKKYQDKKLEMPIFVLGGAGSIQLFEELTKLKDNIAKQNPEIAKRIYVFHGYKDQFAYAIQLASDFYMMPCRFEPCGLTQMEAMAKGALPLAMSTGGLVDTITDEVDGFRTEVFFCNNHRVYGSNIAARTLNTNEKAYTKTLEKALQIFYEHPETISAMKKNAMEKDFGWETPKGSLEKYYSLFHCGQIF